MKPTVKILSILIIAFSSLGGCNNNDDPVPQPHNTLATNDQSDRANPADNNSLNKSNADQSDDNSLEAKSESGLEKVSSAQNSLPKPVNPSIGGAKIGDAAMLNAVSLCNTQGQFFDRFSGTQGSCSKAPIAKVKCESKGLSTLLDAAQLIQFKDSMAGTFKGWLIDQCVDCQPATNLPECRNKNGQRQVGTKVFFVSTISGDVNGKSMLIPARPDDGLDSSVQNDSQGTGTDGELGKSPVHKTSTKSPTSSDNTATDTSTKT